MENTTQKHRIAIVLLAYNSKSLVEKFLPKIIKHTPVKDDIAIYVVDNGSSEPMEPWIRKDFPSVIPMRIEENHGFTNGYVASLAQINAEYYVLISSDIEVTEGWLDEPIAKLESQEAVAACQPKIKSWDRKHEFEYAGAAGGFLDYLGYPFCRGRMVNVVETDHEQYNNSIRIFWASGACLFIKSKAYHEAGGLDNDFFAHMEEIDLCWRLNNMGYEIHYCPTSVVYHVGGSVIKYGSPMKVYRNHRNNLVMLTKNLAPYQGIVKIPIRFVFDFLTLVKMVFDGEWKTAPAISKAHINYLVNLPTWLKKRKEIKPKVVSYKTYGIYPKSMVWAFFAKGIKYFDDLHWNPNHNK